MKNILVTGGAGFIGSHTVVELFEAGYNPVIVDNLSNSLIGAIDGIEKIIGKKPTFYKMDFQNIKELAKVISDEKINGVIHFAALKAVGESTEQPLKYYRNNVSGFIDFLELMTKNSLPLVFSSSCTVYGEPDRLPVHETSVLKPAESPYGASKQMDEIIMQDVIKTKKMKGISLRYFNPVGAHQSGFIGELPLGKPSNLFPVITQTIAGSNGEITVFGNDYDTPDGSCIRDYIHVVDLAKAHISALKYLNAQSIGFYDVFNIGSGHGNSVFEIIHTFEKTTGLKVPYRIGKRRMGDVVATYADCSKANKELGWHTVKSLEDACRDSWNWQQKLK